MSEREKEREKELGPQPERERERETARARDRKREIQDRHLLIFLATPLLQLLFVKNFVQKIYFLVERQMNVENSS